MAGKDLKKRAEKGYGFLDSDILPDFPGLEVLDSKIQKIVVEKKDKLKIKKRK
ncbi:hypothetical protein GM418_21565 [Maribellus comscasis]|uniref:Uncharacterized protein n=1 Tax=Maribellus comscasis TaxID=2681766 RepID=A0A6I6JXS9_9BACT|nr:hypothetical protein [Maribellus comscasis]QGY46159.1 hypothetical protein GM418_21565 [Maribellus comscasis]